MAVGALTAVVAVGACAVVPALTAGAGTAGTSSPQSLAAQAAALQAQIVDTAQRLHTLAVATEAASARLTADTGALDSTQATLTQLRGQLAQATVAARTTAVDTYMNEGGGTGSALAGLFSDTSSDVAAGQAYADLASDTEADAIDRYKRDQTLVTQRQAQLASERSADAAAYQALAEEYAGLQQVAASEQSMLGRVQQAQVAAAVQAAAGPPSTVPIGSLAAPGGSMADDLARLRQCESGDDYQADTGNGYYGAYQFALSTWQSLGYSGLPSQAAPATQDQAAMTLQQRSGWGQWPVCAALLGLG